MTRLPSLGISITRDPRGVLIEQVDSTGSAGAAGVRTGDYLVAVNDVSVEDQGFSQKFRAMFANAKDGEPLSLRVRRGSETLTLNAKMQLAPGEVSIVPDPNASVKATRIRNGILKGTVDR